MGFRFSGFKFFFGKPLRNGKECRGKFALAQYIMKPNCIHSCVNCLDIYAPYGFKNTSEFTKKALPFTNLAGRIYQHVHRDIILPTFLHTMDLVLRDYTKKVQYHLLPPDMLEWGCVQSRTDTQHSGAAYPACFETAAAAHGGKRP